MVPVGVRTPDPLLNTHTLNHLSYTQVAWLYILETIQILFIPVFHVYLCYSKLLSGVCENLPNLVDLLVQADLYDMAFTVLLRFFRGSDLKRYSSVLL